MVEANADFILSPPASAGGAILHKVMNFVSAATLASNGGLDGEAHSDDNGNLPTSGYDIVPDRQWSKWCVSVYSTRADLPLFSRSTLRTLSFREGRGCSRGQAVH